MGKVRSKLLYPMALLSFLGLPGPLNSQSLATIAGGQLASDLLSQVASEIDALLGRVDVSVGSAAFAASQAARLVVDEARFAAAQLVGKTFAELNAAQRDFVNSSFALLDEMKRSTSAISSDLQFTVDKAALALSVVPGTNREPRVASYSPSFSVSPIAAGDNINITVKGLFLNHRPASMNLEGSRCALNRSTDLELGFVCKLPDSFVTESRNSRSLDTLDGVINVALPTGFWESIGAIFTGSAVKYKEYAFSSKILPEIAATIDVVYTRNEDRQTTSQRAQAFDTGARHCTSGSFQRLGVAVQAPGWSVVPNSITVVKHSCNNGNAIAEKVSHLGFELFAWGHNSGKCVRIAGIKDARGWCNGHVSWQETRVDPAPVEIKSPARDVKWGEIVSIPMDGSIIRYTARINLFNGQRVEIGSPEAKEFFALKRTSSNSIGFEVRGVDYFR